MSEEAKAFVEKMAQLPEEQQKQVTIKNRVRR